MSYIPEQALTELYLESEQGRYSLLLGGDELRKLRPKLYPHQHFLWEIDAWELVESDLRTHEWVVTINQNIRDELGKNHRLPSQQVCMNPRFESLRFNEVMFDPLQDPMDNQPNGVEYLEIWNQENISICLENLFLKNFNPKKIISFEASIINFQYLMNKIQILKKKYRN